MWRVGTGLAAGHPISQSLPSEHTVRSPPLPILPPRKVSALLSLGDIWEHILGSLFTSGNQHWTSSSYSSRREGRWLSWE